MSRTGKAEPISYDELLDVPTVPDGMRQLELRFVADEETLKVQTFQYGDSFDETIYPDIPEKDGYYGQWDVTDLTDLHFDTTVTAVYTRYVTTVPGEVRRDSGRAVFFVDGDYDADAQLTTQTMALSNSGLCPVSAGLSEAISHYMSVNPWYTWFSAPITKEIVEQWSVSIPDDGEAVHTLHYLSPSESTRHLAVFVRQDGGWKRAQADTFGSYLTFDISGSQAEIAVVSVLHIWWVWTILAVLILGLIALLIVLLSKAAKRRRKTQTAPEGGENPDGQAKKKKFPVWLTVLLMLLALAAAAASVYFFVIRSKFAPYQALAELNQSPEFSMNLLLDADMGEEAFELSASVERKTAGGHRVTRVGFDDLPLYYAENLVVLENGTAYQLTSEFPDYSAILSNLTSIYQQTSFTTLKNGDETVYGVSVDTDGAETLVGLLLPKTGGRLPDGQTLSAEVHMENGSVEKITISASGTLKDQAQTPFQLYMTLDGFDAAANFSVPDAVLESLDKTYADGELPVITDDLFRLINGWSNLLSRQTLAADLDVSVDCGPVVVKNALRYYRGTIDGVTVNCINKSGLNIFFSDAGSAVTADGEEASGDARSLTGTAKLLDIVYLVCLEGDFTSEEQDGVCTYRVVLSSRAMDDMLAAVAPEAEKLEIDFTDSFAEVTIEDDTVSALRISCGGSVKVLLTSASADVAADITFVDAEMPEVPDSVFSALR